MSQISEKVVKRFHKKATSLGGILRIFQIPLNM